MTFSLDKARAYQLAALDNAQMDSCPDVHAEALSMLLAAVLLLKQVYPDDAVRGVVKGMCEDAIDPVLERRH